MRRELGPGEGVAEAIRVILGVYCAGRGDGVRLWLKASGIMHASLYDLQLPNPTAIEAL